MARLRDKLLWRVRATRAIVACVAVAGGSDGAFACTVLSRWALSARASCGGSLVWVERARLADYCSSALSWAVAAPGAQGWRGREGTALAVVARVARAVGCSKALLRAVAAAPARRAVGLASQALAVAEGAARTRNGHCRVDRTVVAKRADERRPGLRRTELASRARTAVSRLGSARDTSEGAGCAREVATRLGTCRTVVARQALVVSVSAGLGRVCEPACGHLQAEGVAGGADERLIRSRGTCRSHRVLTIMTSGARVRRMDVIWLLGNSCWAKVAICALLVGHHVSLSRHW